MNIEKIIDIGLTKKEAAIYLSALENGVSSITRLATLAKIKRPTAYLVLEDLLNKKLLTAIPFGKNTHYAAGDPIILAKDIELKRTAIANLLPELKNLYRSNQKQVVTKTIFNKQKSTASNKENIKSKNSGGIFTVNRFFLSFTKKK
jgi:sugar-specific transcriptional regulator TrmB